MVPDQQLHKCELFLLFYINCPVYSFFSLDCGYTSPSFRKCLYCLGESMKVEFRGQGETPESPITFCHEYPKAGPLRYPGVPGCGDCLRVSARVMDKMRWLMLRTTGELCFPWFRWISSIKSYLGKNYV